MTDLDRRADSRTPAHGSPGTTRRSATERLLDAGVWVAAATIGLAALLAMAPDGLLDARSELWRFPSGDLGVGVSGMRYFLADSWHWPLLVTNDLRSPDGVNIAFTDSIPLLALATKAARPIVGSDANYFPLWFVTVYTLQGVGAVAFLRAVGVRRRSTLLAGAALAVCFPAFVFRAFHPALNAQFIVLFTLATAAGIGRSPRSAARFAVLAGLLVTALLIHPYLLLMSLPFVVAIALDRWRQGAVSLAAVAAGGLAAVAALATTMIGLGYLDDTVSPADYGQYGLNLVGPVWPQLSWLAPGDEQILDVGGTRYEAFNWLGFGVLLTLAVAAVVAHRELRPKVRRWSSVVVAAAAVTAVAVTHIVTYGTNGLYSLVPRLESVHASSARLVVVAVALGGILAALARWRRPTSTLFRVTLVAAWAVAVIFLRMGPTQIAATFSPIRGSGRMWWPIGLLLALGAVVLIDRSRVRWARVLLGVAVVVQAVDVIPVRDAAAEAVAARTHLPGAERLAEAAAAEGIVRISPSFFCAPFPDGTLAVLDTIVAASVAGTPIDTAYTAREPLGVVCPETPQSVRPGELLVLVPPALRNPGHLLDDRLLCRDDGTVMACTSRWAGVPVADTLPFRPVIAEPIAFAAAGDAAPYLVGEWEPAEEWGVPLRDSGSTVTVPLVAPATGPVAVRIVLRGLESAAATLTIEAAGATNTVSVPSAGRRVVEVVLPAVPTDRLEITLTPVGGRVGIDLLTVLLAP